MIRLSATKYELAEKQQTVHPTPRDAEDHVLNFVARVSSANTSDGRGEPVLVHSGQPVAM